MLFNSISFFVFFPVVTILYFALPHKYRWMFLLGASCVFYMAFIPWYILILAIIIGIDYWAGMRIEESQGRRRKTWLIASIVSTSLVLIVFKYFNFFNTNMSAIADFFHWNYSVGFMNIILPIGLSFHTFQSLAYVIEVYRGNQKAEKHFGIYSLYVMFYPQLVAGPIERPQNLIHQFYEEHKFEYQRIVEGLRKMLWGFFKKMVIADNLAIYVNAAYGNPTDYSGLVMLTASFFFAVQIYCDFSGYSDIAIGSAKVMGFNLMENFKNPYFSTSIAEFWRRWHISLSTWFRDYVYIPLGGNRLSRLYWYRNIMIAFVLSGFWHGANWTYVIWGAIHGIYLLASDNIGKLLQKNSYFASVWLIPLKRLWIFLLVLVAWVFFRANTLADARFILINSWSNLSLTGWLQPIAYDRAYFAFMLALVVVLFTAEIIDYKSGSIVNVIGRQKRIIRYLVYFVLVMSVMNLGVTREAPFIYFQF